MQLEERLLPCREDVFGFGARDLLYDIPALRVDIIAACQAFYLAYRLLALAEIIQGRYIIIYRFDPSGYRVAHLSTRNQKTKALTPAPGSSLSRSGRPPTKSL